MTKEEKQDLIIEVLTEAVANKNLTILKYQKTIKTLENIINGYETILMKKKKTS